MNEKGSIGEMISKETQIEAIVYFSKEDDLPIPLRLKIFTPDEPVVIKVKYVAEAKPDTFTFVKYICVYEDSGVEKRIRITYDRSNLKWHLTD